MKKKKILKIIFISLIILLIIRIINYPKNSNAIIKIYDKNNNQISLIINNHKTSDLNLDELNKRYIDFIIEIEDKNFYRHQGFSLPDLARVIIKRNGGASTITQQVIKNIYLNNKKTITRKIKEIIMAYKLEKALNKNEILKLYLECIYFGNNIYGLSNASKYYYDKSVKDLSINEIISLIALWNSPSIYSNNIKKWNNKKNQITKILLNNKLITKNEYHNSIKDITLKKNNNYINSNKQYYIDQVLAEFRQNEIKSNSIIHIYTEYNNKTESINEASNHNYAAYSYTKDGYITSIIGDKNYNKSNFNIVMNGKRDIGSTIKPLLYYEAIKCNQKNTFYYSSPYTFRFRDEIFTITNSNNHYYGKINMKNAIAVSDNIYAIKTHLSLGMNTLVYQLKKYGIKADPIPSLALGSVGMSLYELGSIYSQFFKDGNYFKPKFIKKIKINSDYFSNKIKNISLNNKDICKEIKELLGYTFSPEMNGTSSIIQNKLKYKCYGKSGSTKYDSYLVGFSDNIFVAAWSGDILNKEANDELDYLLSKKIFYLLINSH